MSYATRATRAADVYCAAMGDLAESIRQDLVIPFCERTGMRFCAGMGSWDFNGKGKSFAGWQERAELRARHRLGARLYDALTIEWGVGSGRQDVGSLIASYTPTTYKA